MKAFVYFIAGILPMIYATYAILKPLNPPDLMLYVSGFGIGFVWMGICDKLWGGR